MATLLHSVGKSSFPFLLFFVRRLLVHLLRILIPFTFFSKSSHFIPQPEPQSHFLSLLCAPPPRSSPPSPNPIYFLLWLRCPSSRIEWACSRSCAGAPALSGVQSSSLATSRCRRPRPTSSSGSWSTPRSTPTPPTGLTPPSPWSPPPPPSSSVYEGEFVEDWITIALVYTAMIDYPTALNFLTPLPAYLVKQIISITTVSTPDPVSGHPLAGESGGLSGNPLFDLSTNILKEMYMLTQGKFPLIGCGGISSGEDAYKKIRAGATLVQLYTAFSYGGPALIPQIKVYSIAMGNIHVSTKPGHFGWKI